MGLNTKRLNRTQSSTNKGNSSFFKLEDGSNVVRVFTFPHKVKKSDFTKGFYKKDDAKVGDKFDELEREVMRHFVDDGMVNCILKDCEHCKEADELMASDDKKDKKAGGMMKARPGYYVNIVDINDIEKGIQLCSFPSSVFGVILSDIMDPDYGEDILGPQGRDYKIERNSKAAKPQDYYSTKLRDEKRCDDLDEELKEDVADLFEMTALDPGWSSNEDLKDVAETDVDEHGNETGEDNDLKDDETPETGTDESESGEPEGGSSDDLPWEDGKEKRTKKSEKEPEEDEFAVGVRVSFQEDDETFVGNITKKLKKKGEWEVETKDDLWDLPESDLTIVKQQPKKKSKKRRNK